MAAASTAMRMLVRYGLRWGVTVISMCAWVHVFQVAEARHWPTRFQVWSSMDELGYKGHDPRSPSARPVARRHLGGHPLRTQT